MKKPGFYKYGEGSVSHYEGPCPEGLGFHHPQIERVTWPSRWAYCRNSPALWCHDRWIRSVARSGYFKRQRDLGITREYVSSIPRGWVYRVALWLFGEPFPNNPRVWAPLKPEDSIYSTAVRDAREHEDRQVGRQR